MSEMERIDRALKKQQAYVEKLAERFASTDERLHDQRAALRREHQAAEALLNETAPASDRGGSDSVPRPLAIKGEMAMSSTKQPRTEEITSDERFIA